MQTIGGTILGLFVVPIAIEQNPEIFKESAWILPVSVCVVAVCWLIPLLLHENAKSLWERGVNAIGLKKFVVVVLVIVGLCLFALYGFA